MNTQRHRTSLAIATLLLALAACTSTSQETAPSPASTPESTIAREPSPPRPAPALPTSLSASTEDAVHHAITSYTLLWQDYAMAAATSDYSTSTLSRHASDQALRELQGWLYRDRIAGLITLGRPAPTPRVLAVRVPEMPIEVLVADCLDAALWPKYLAAGGRSDKPPAGRQHIDATVRLDRGRWTVIGLTLASPGTC
ncbi:hypothetical protein NLX83_15600 [Allokutzneria sp. A3M-2-11 16]|uniref:hypothetical protein n=1 Tax=Allokutzneria sp. A3M-2-11 16 TaxID=2962043 RepID=UPI0020B64FB1|nr:hypothetical protein [Allokutzneria sp. A3M-2-11 16]MCP3800692.1 hypothetical protein [Allokutzneria sp. A3M-2-11 16]